MKGTLPKYYKQIVLIFILSAYTFASHSQQFARKNLENIKPQIYGGDVQIWDIAVGFEEYMFFATGNSISIWDGTRWESVSTTPEHYFRSLFYDNQTQRLYCSGNNVFGYWTQDNTGSFNFTELFNDTGSGESNIFWRSIAIDEQIYFQTHEKIFRYNTRNDQIETLPVKGYINYIHKLGNNIYVQIDSRFYEISGIELRALPFELDSRVVYMERRESRLYLISETKGVYILENGLLREADPESNNKMVSARVFSASSLDSEHFLIGTVLDGLYIIDNDGKITDRYGEEQALNYTTVLSLDVDSIRNIWIGLDGAIAKIDANPRQSYYNSYNKKIGSVYALCEHNDKLYLGTNKGLYVIIDNDTPPHFISGTEGQVWDILKIGGEIIVSHDKGMLRIVDQKVTERIHNSSWQIKPLKSNNNLYYSASQDGFIVYEATKGRFTLRNKIEGYNGMFNNSLIDKYGFTWITGLQKEVRRLTADVEYRKIETNKTYPIPDLKEGDWIGASLLDDEAVFFSNNRCYTYDISQDRINFSPYYTSLFESIGNTVTNITQNGNTFYYICDQNVGFVERRGDTFINHGLIFRPTKEKMIPIAFRKIINLSEGKVAMGYENGVAFYDANIENTDQRYPIRLKKIEYTLKGDKYAVDLSNYPDIPPFAYGSVNIRFLLNNISKDGTVYISLDNKPWESIQVEEALEFPYINSGSHTLRIKRSLQFEHQIEVNFEVSHPFSSSITFWTIIAAIITLVILLTYRIYSLRIQKIRRRIMDRQAELLEREKINFENQKLSLEVKDRDKRLTSFAMNSIKFNNTLNDIETEIRNIRTSDPVLKSQLRAIARKITSYRRNEDNWAIFEKYFNNVYDGFFDKLNRDYPNLTPNDMKIAAYIKLGLSTKEIAVLMTISPGSVDTARHRLRKKLDLTTEISLTEFLSKI